MFTDYFLLALKSISHRKLRSWLTVIGIVIGVAAIISLITLSRSLEDTIEDQFDQFGANRILVSAKGFQGPGTSQGLTIDDVETIEKISGLDYVIPGIFRNAEVNYKGQTGFTLVVGIPSEWYEDFYKDTGIEIKNGRNIKDDETYVALIGSRVVTDMFDKEVHIGDKIEMGHSEFRVVGILEEVGNAQDDNQIYIPLDAAREIFDEEEAVDLIIVQVESSDKIPQIQEKIEKELEQKRNDTNFQVVTATQILEQIGQVLGIMQIVLVGIAAISLIVGTIGIMNSMYTNVLERTKEIGIMKAIGARNKDILILFLIESGMIGFVGGALGVLLGSGLAYTVGSFSQGIGFTINIKLEPLVLIFGLLFAFVVGILAGVLPAYQASRLKPIDALRYE